MSPKITKRLIALTVFAVELAITLHSAEGTGIASSRADDEVIALDQLTVSAATRTEKLASALPVTTTVVTAEQLDRQFSLSTDLGQALAQFIPSYAPSRQKLTSRGESFRGRDPLYLVDGIPQSNPLRAGNRESVTVDPFFLEKVEVVHGSSAAQGLGATGGIVNYITQRARLKRFGLCGERFDGSGSGPVTGGAQQQQETNETSVFPRCDH